MTKQSIDHRAVIAAAFSKKIRAAIALANRESVGNSPADRALALGEVVDHLADHFAGQIIEAAQVGQKSATTQVAGRTAAAAAVSRLSSPGAVRVMQADPDEVAFNTQRRFDVETGQRIQTVRIAR
jgi:hypothetical protein